MKKCRMNKISTLMLIFMLMVGSFFPLSVKASDTILNEDYLDVAEGKVATADSWQTIQDRTPEKGNDGDDSTRWSASDGHWGHWWKVDLGESHNLYGSTIHWEFNKIYKYKIEVSADDKNWLMVVDQTENSTANQVESHSFNVTDIRYVRITITETEKGLWASFYDFKVVGEKGLSNPMAKTPYIPQNSDRVQLNFNTHWLYSNQDIPDGQDPNCDETGFTEVSLPHSNKVLNKHYDLDISQVQFVSWYRRHFRVPSEYEGQEVNVAFEGVGTVAQVYVNGHYVGEHKGAYTSFIFDITDYIKFGEDKDNIIAIRVDATERKDIPPEGGIVDIDFFLFGGITRDVNMIITNPIHVDWTFNRTVPLEDDSVVVASTTKVLNKSSQNKQCTVITHIVDSNNNVVATGSSSSMIKGYSSQELNNFSTRIVQPHLWHPDDPYLYTLYTQVQVDDLFVDEYETKTGLRWIEFNNTDGKFYINDDYLKLRGTNRHETYPFIGRSASNRLQERDADIIKYDMGCNMVRCSHYVQDPAFLARCDEIGLLVVEETPGWMNIGGSAWKDIVLDNIEEMLVRDRNHPSIVAWSIRINESIDDNIFYRDTNDKARSLDPTRPTTGSRFVANYLSTFLEDVFGYNDFTEGIRNPRVLPWLVTEYEGHMFPVKSFDKEERLIENMLRHAHVQNEAYKQESISGALSWCAFDYNTPLADSYSDNNIRYHGAYDMFRMPKHVAYFYQSQRNPDLYGEMVYIANYWNNHSPTKVIVASNCEEVELFINGVSQGIKKPNLYTNLPHPLFEFSQVNYEEGEIRADGYRNGEVVATHIRHTSDTAVKLVLEADASSLVADGSDMTRVTVMAVDQYDQIVPLADHQVDFQVTGVGTFLGETPFVLEDGKGGFFVKTLIDEPGQITCKAITEGLEEATINITVKPMTIPIVPIVKETDGDIPLPGTDVALYKYATSDSEQMEKGNRAYCVNDGSLDTRWCANNWDEGHWWMVDLGQSYDISGTEVTFEKGDTVYKYQLEVSSDKNEWITAVDKRDNSDNSQVVRDLFVSNDVRYVRITITGLEKHAWASIYDFKVFAE